MLSLFRVLANPPWTRVCQSGSGLSRATCWQRGVLPSPISAVALMSLSVTLLMCVSSVCSRRTRLRPENQSKHSMAARQAWFSTNGSLHKLVTGYDPVACCCWRLTMDWKRVYSTCLSGMDCRADAGRLTSEGCRATRRHVEQNEHVQLYLCLLYTS